MYFYSHKRIFMRIDILSVVPELLTGPFSHSILKRAEKKGLAEVHVHDIREYSTDRHRKVDDYAFSGGAGMVMTIQPIESAINALVQQRRRNCSGLPSSFYYSRKHASALYSRH